MADDADLAADFQERLNAEALAKRENPSDLPSAFYCAECDEVIPHARRAAIAGVQLCVDCQGIKELKN